MIKHHYKDYISQYVAYSSGEFIDSSAGEFPVMLIAEDICGRWLGICWYALQMSTNENSRAISLQGAKVPGSELARARIGNGPIGRIAPGRSY